METGRIDLSDVAAKKGGRIGLTPPGRILERDVMKPLGLTSYRLAKDIHVPLNRVTAILAGERAISADTSIRLGRYLGMSPGFWHRLQADYDLRSAQRVLGRKVLAGIEPLRAAE
ncbi:MAG: HigA family addiction module antitoxin [Alphaproteobacteria bacterium]